MASESIDPPDAGGQARVPLTPAQRHVAELAEEGRRQQAAARAAEEAESRRTERRERREVERLGRANVRAALLESPREASPPLLAIAIGGVVAGTVLLMAAEGLWSTAGLALILLAGFGFFAARWVVGIRLVGAERAWLRSLPFPVRGYFRVLGDTPSEERQVRLRIRFRGVAPEREVLEGILGRVHLPATARLAGGAGSAWTVESGPVRTVIVDDVAPANASTLWWMRSVTGEALLPLHEAYPLGGVEFSG